MSKKKTPEELLVICKSYYAAAPFATKSYLALQTKIDYDFISKNWLKITGEQSKNEGWSWNVTDHNKTHYYKDGVSLCGKAKEKEFMKQFDKTRIGSKYFFDCMICEKKRKELSEKKVVK
jgi:hypothetical protein